MRHFFLLLLIVFGISCTQNSEKQVSSTVESTEVSDTTKDGVFIHITESYNDPHCLLMPLKMATIMADDKDVILYMDIHAVNILVKDAEDINYTGFESAKTYINRLLEKNIDIYVCPTCLRAAGFTPDDLAEGIQLADKDKFFSFTHGRILTLDY